MSKKFLVSIDMNRNELQNAVLHPLAAAPASASIGQVYYNSVDKLLYIYDGSAWTAVGSVLSVNGKTGVVVIDKSDVGLGNVDNTSDADKPVSTATQTALDGKLNLSGGTMSGAIAMGSNKITGLATPTNDADASTKKYVDDQISGLGTLLEFKGTVATESDLPLSGMSKGDVYIVTTDNSEWVWTSDSATGTIADYEKLGPTIDLSGYLEKSGGTMTGAINMGSNKITNLATPTADADAATKKYVDDTAGGVIMTATGTIGTSATSAEVSYSGTLINAYATMGGAVVVCDIAVTASKVTFSTAAAPSAAVTCVVVYA